MKGVLAFFLVVAALAVVWIQMPRRDRTKTFKVARKFWPAIAVAAAVTAAFLFLAFFTNGKVI